MDAASKFKSMQANARIIKYYRSKVMKCITESIKDSFDEAYTQNEQNLGAFLDNLGWIYKDIYRIEKNFVPCFSLDYEKYSHFVKEYHKSLNEKIKKLLGAEPEACVLHILHQWLKEYNKTMKELEV